MSEERRADEPEGDGGLSARGEEASASGASPTPISDALIEGQARIVELEGRVAQLERELAAEREAATDYMQRWQRAQADFANLKRRTQQEQEHLQRLAGAQALAGILPAVDSFERAFATLPPTLSHFSWIDGIGLVHLQLHGALQAAGIKMFAPDRGAPYDPHREQAIGDIETAEVPPGSVAAVVQQGYALGDLILRPALVQLAKAPPAAAGSPPGTSSEPEAMP